MPTELTGFAEALLIGLIIGIQRETSHPKHNAGVRDFLLIALTGGICGFLGNAWLTAAALLAITVFLAVYHWECKDDSGITTEMAAIATYCLAVLAAAPTEPIGSGLAVGAAIVMVVFLEAKRALHRFIRETITDTEFNDTLWFLAIIFIVYPVLPEGQFGPYDAISPKHIWLFVILVS
ncbi:MAG: MgtC/SapB family protein, partial [bacterium]|nr:MgtC/SapB family protein [bacterium]